MTVLSIVKKAIASLQSSCHKTILPALPKIVTLD